MATNTYSVTFAPNPDRRHSRGRRGQESGGIAALTDDFDEMKLLSDWHSVKSDYRDRDAAKIASAAEKARRLRGYHVPHGNTRRSTIDKEEMYARRQRLKTGTDVCSRKEHRQRMQAAAFFSRNEGETRGTHQSKIGAKPFDLKHAVARFKRIGEVPSVPLSVVRSVPHDGIDGAALRRMIEAMLVRGGIEENPGYDAVPHFDEDGFAPCPLAGFVCKGERVVAHGKKFFVCPRCSKRLENIDGGYGFHPGHQAVGGYDLNLTPPTKPSNEFISPYVHPEMFQSLPMPIPPGTPAPPPPPRHSAPTPPAMPPALPRTPAPVPPVIVNPVVPVVIPPPPANPAPPEPVVLEGHHASADDEVAAVSRLVGHNVLEEDLECVDRVVQYHGDHRLVGSRSVKEVQQAFTIRQINYTDRLVWPDYLLSSLFMLVRLCLIVPRFITYVSPWAIPVPVQLEAFGVCAFVYFLTQYLLSRYPPYVREYHIAYVPHILSSVIAEYDRGTNAVTVRSTIRSRIRRLACFPLPDRDALVIISGTELMAETILETQDFFWEGAACCRLPQ